MAKTGLGNKAMKEKYSQAIIAYDYKTGHYIGEYPSLKEAEKALGVRNGNISLVVRGIRNQSGGYTFNYKI
jgi:hypothetical protein